MMPSPGIVNFSGVATADPKIPGPEKAAILIITLGLELAAPVFKFLRQDEVERIVVEIAKATSLSAESRDAVLAQAYQRTIALTYLNEGGIEYAKEILESSFGASQADDMTGQLFATLKHGNPLELVKKTDPAQLLQFIQDEHPQTIALILVYMNPEQAGALLWALPPELQTEVAMRVAILEKAAPEVLEQLDELLGRRLLVSGAEFGKAGSVQSLANVMNFIDSETERNILEGLTKRDPELAQEVKNLLFVFEDIVNLDDRSIQRILREVDGKDLAFALKGAKDALLDRVGKNMSPRAFAALKDEIELLGATRMREVEKARHKIADAIRTLQENGEINVARHVRELR